MTSLALAFAWVLPLAAALAAGEHERIGDLTYDDALWQVDRSGETYSVRSNSWKG